MTELRNPGSLLDQSKLREHSPGSDSPPRQLFLSALILMAAVPALRMSVEVFRDPYLIAKYSNFRWWIVAYLLFATLLWLGIKKRATLSETAYRLTLGAQSILALGMFSLLCSGFEGALLVAVAAQLAREFPLWPTIGLIAAQSALMGSVVVRKWMFEGSVALITAWIVCQAFAVLVSRVAAAESARRRELENANRSLAAHQQLLLAAGVATERLQIAREMHDVLGHHLTALSLNLEVARHSFDGESQERVATAQKIAKELLVDVRQVVSKLRDKDQVDLGRAIQTLLGRIPDPQIHLTMPDELKLDDPARAEAILRCVQEVITNTARHAHARNLWITVARHGDEISVVTRDDGPGSIPIQPGNGLTGMKERVERAGGWLRWNAPTGQGFQVELGIPIPRIGA